jgi:hypothetical protein
MLRIVAIVSLFLVACGSAGGLSDGQEESISANGQSDDRTQELAQRFFEVVVSAVESGGVTLTDDARGEVAAITRAGAAKLNAGSSTREAEDAFQDLGQKIVEDARFDEQTGKRTAFGETVITAWRRWCPRYPFC